LQKSTSSEKNPAREIENTVSPKASAPNPLMQKEDRQLGKVAASTYEQYFKCASEKYGVFWMILTLGIFALVQILKNCGDYWLLFWAQDSQYLSNSEIYWIWTNALWIILLFAAIFIRSIVFVNLSTNASQNLHDSIFKALLSASIPRFFDVTPIGQILNRFSKDLDNIDVILPDLLSQVFIFTFQIISALIITAIGSPFVLLIILPILSAFVWIRTYFSKSSREIKRIDGISRSPIFSTFAETLNGLSTIRGFDQVSNFIKINHEVLQTNARAFLATVCFYSLCILQLSFISFLSSAW
jgi:ABC-type multidrug transport system fused ATPase/permease subunit